jgi:hypothetical protein
MDDRFRHVLLLFRLTAPREWVPTFSQQQLVRGLTMGANLRANLQGR